MKKIQKPHHLSYLGLDISLQRNRHRPCQRQSQPEIYQVQFIRIEPHLARASPYKILLQRVLKRPIRIYSPTYAEGSHGKFRVSFRARAPPDTWQTWTPKSTKGGHRERKML